MTHGVKLTRKTAAAVVGFLLIAVMFVMPRSVRAEVLGSGTINGIDWTLEKDSDDSYTLTLENAYIIDSSFTNAINNYFAQYISDAPLNFTGINIVVGDGFTTIDTGAFKDTNLKSIVLPQGLDEIKSNAFRNCYGLETINVPTTVSSLGGSCFYNCTSLSSFTIYSSTNCGDAFNSNSGANGLLLNYYGSRASAMSNGNLYRLVTKSDGNAVYTKYRITYYDLGSELGYEEIDAVSGAKFTKPADPVKAGELFKGWWVNDEYGDPIDEYYDFNSVVKDDVSVTANFVPDVNSLEGVSLSLSGDIEVNFKISTKTDAESVKLECEIPGKTNNVVTSGITASGTYSIHIAPSAMTCPIKVYVDGTQIGNDDGYTVKSYAAAIIANADNIDAYAAAKDLVVAMVNYGAYSQKYFDVNKNDLANDIDGVTDNVPTATVDERLIDITLKQSGTDIDAFPFKYYGSSLVLNDVTTAYVYFRYPDSVKLSDYIFQVDGISVTPMDAGENFICFQKVITAADLDKANNNFVITIDKLSGAAGDPAGLHFNYRPTIYSYAVSQVTDGSVSEDLVNLTKAFYLYALKATKSN